jgi:hypothetical protein
MIGINARFILDIFEYCENNNENGILLFLDFEKAFDSVEWNFLFKTLEKFNFGPNFLKWIKILYHNPIFRLKNNGWITKTCKMQRGIRQGCPISALLYLYIAEILSLKIKNNNMIEGFRAKNMNKEVKNIQHADDMTLALKNIESLNQALNTINNFCIHAGSKINVSKTECILLGPLKDMFSEIRGITVSNRAVKCLGIYIGHDKIECYNKNWMKVYHDIDTLFESWKRRKLTLFGKCTVTNSLAISKLVYLANILELPDETYFKKINRLIYNFIWNKTDRIKRNTLIGKVEDGGMGITDIESKFKALKASWVRKLENTDHCIVSYLNSYVPNNIDFNYLTLTSEKRIKNFEIL